MWITTTFLHQMQRSSGRHLKERMILPKMDYIALPPIQNSLDIIIMTTSSHPHPTENQSERNPHLKRTLGQLLKELSLWSHNVKSALSKCNGRQQWPIIIIDTLPSTATQPINAYIIKNILRGLKTIIFWIKKNLLISWFLTVYILLFTCFPGMIALCQRKNGHQA